MLVDSVKVMAVKFVDELATSFAKPKPIEVGVDAFIRQRYAVVAPVCLKYTPLPLELVLLTDVLTSTSASALVVEPSFM